MVRKEQINYQRSRNIENDSIYEESSINDALHSDYKSALLVRNKNDAYQKSLLKLVNQIEDVYKLDTIADTNTREEIRDLPINDLNNHLTGIVPSLSAVAKRERNLEVSGIMAGLNYLGFSIIIRNEERVSFDDHPALSSLIKSVSYFADGKQFLYDKDFQKNLITILTILEKYENKSFMRINIKLSYKLLRLIYLLLLYGNKLDASMVSIFVIDQARKSLTRVQKNIYENTQFHHKESSNFRSEAEETRKEKYDRYVARQNREYNTKTYGGSESQHTRRTPQPNNVGEGGNLRNGRQTDRTSTRRKRVNTTVRK